MAFDQYYNNITSNQAPGLTEYEKSKHLTAAQKTVVIGLYNGTLRNSFEETEEWTDYLDTLVSQKDECIKVATGLPRVCPDSQIFLLPNDLMFRTLETCYIDTEDCGNQQAIIVPVTQDEFWHTYRNPFKGANDRRVLRLAYAMGTTKYSELVSKSPVTKYTVRYLKNPEPIILTDLSADGLSIEGKTASQTCLLSERIHDLILEEAVRQAKAVWAA